MSRTTVRAALSTIGIVMLAVALFGVAMPAHAGLFVQANPAQAADQAPRPAGAVGEGSVSIQRGCNVTPAPGVGGVNARSAPNQSAPRNGIIPAGAVADADCVATAGGSYTCPRGSSTWWVRVTWPAGVTSFVAERCVIWNVD